MNNSFKKVYEKKVVCPYCGTITEINYETKHCEEKLYFNSENEVTLECTIDCDHCRSLIRWKKTGKISSYQEETTVVESRDERFSI